MSCEICDNLKKNGSGNIREIGHFMLLLEYDKYGNPSIVARDETHQIGGNGIRIAINNCPMCGEELGKRRS